MLSKVSFSKVVNSRDCAVKSLLRIQFYEHERSHKRIAEKTNRSGGIRTHAEKIFV